ncbi:uncharacterized protein BKA55DRAFT_676928 [Fusarium redolens]|uniref:NAD-dependent epimerase/dehydratase domain-containing protein n=1 Tax=Fusarium redolens TaxID=48865 RepID=A0A9P9H0I1_FUSRE|nr:uncharacterized protein BKA55DRAFT_676928 [Fusarium redolens]KAH7247627.1 hypothetical protein BKA55DRAFT_676928 [Fusarium redolens]
MAPLDNVVVPKGSLVLVTGANGLLGSHIAKQFLEYGYKVRGTVRDATKFSWLLELFRKDYGRDSFELVQVDDLAAKGALDEAVKGATVVAHTASVVSFDPDPNKVIPFAVDFAVNALETAYKEPSVKRFVFTSSSAAAVISSPDIPPANITEDSWTDFIVDAAWADPPYTPERGMTTYAASKNQAEKEVWKFHKENRQKRPDLVVNTVLPNFNFGRSLDREKQGYPSSSLLPLSLFKGEVSPFHEGVTPQYFVDVDDTGRLHVAVAVLPNLEDQRIFAFAGRFNWDTVLDIFRKHVPDRKFPDNFSGGVDGNEILPRGKAEQLLRDLGRPGWTSLEESILANIEGLY